MALSIPRLLALLIAGLAVVIAAAPDARAATVKMGVVDESIDSTADPVLLDRLAGLDADLYRINVYWQRVAPNGPEKPPGFRAPDPASPHYDFSSLDKLVRGLRSRGIQPILTVFKAPAWAERSGGKNGSGTYHPSPGHLRHFAIALARRYSGRFSPAGGDRLPRVRYFQAWNEPNFGQYLTTRRKAQAPAHYVRMLNAFYAGVKRVHRSNFVIAAGLGPYGFNGNANDVDPQVFMRSALCLSGHPSRRLVRRKGCTRRARFDAWAQHPYTLAGRPTSKGASRNAGAMGNMSQIKRTLERATSLGTVRPRRRKQLWVTEMGWFSNPPGWTVPDGTQLGVSLRTHGERLSETAYRLWRLDVRAFLWYAIRDYARWPGGLFLTGATFAEDRAKPAADAFALPFYARRSGRGTAVWASVHGARGRSTVAIERRRGDSWTRVARLRSRSNGIVHRRLRTRARGTYRARVLTGTRRGTTSHGFRVR